MTCRHKTDFVKLAVQMAVHVYISMQGKVLRKPPKTEADIRIGSAIYADKSPARVTGPAIFASVYSSIGYAEKSFKNVTYLKSNLPVRKNTR